jgi:Mg2+ and Co2+ transporter CorA
LEIEKMSHKIWVTWDPFRNIRQLSSRTTRILRALGSQLHQINAFQKDETLRDTGRNTFAARMKKTPTSLDCYCFDPNTFR